MHKSQILFYLITALHVSGVTITFRSTKQLHLQHLVTVTPYCCLLLSWKSWNRFERVWVAYAIHNTLRSVPTLPWP